MIPSIINIATTGYFWTGPIMVANVIVVLNIFGALLLGMMVGFERSYRGRAAGVRTYGLVCMASCAIIVITGHTDAWFGGGALFVAKADPTRVMQGITTGVGFLGAGIIHRDGYQTNGLTTAASIWASSAIGIMVGVGFYFAAIFFALLCIACMSLMSYVESFLPSHNELFVRMKFKIGAIPKLNDLDAASIKRGYKIEANTLAISFEDGKSEWKFNVLSNGKSFVPVSDLARDLSSYEGVEVFEIAQVRN
jgi:putative Mg2+ transporter-C (MgtC) family protein